MSADPKVCCRICQQKRLPSDVKSRRAVCARCRGSRPRQPVRNRRLPAALRAEPHDLLLAMASSRALQLVNMPPPHPGPRAREHKGQISDNNINDNKIESDGKRSPHRSDSGSESRWDAIIAAGLAIGPTTNEAKLLMLSPGCHSRLGMTCF